MNEENNGNGILNNDEIETISFGDPVVNDNEGVLSPNFNNVNAAPTESNLQETPQINDDIQAQMLSPFENIQPAVEQSTIQPTMETINTVTPEFNNIVAEESVQNNVEVQPDIQATIDPAINLNPINPMGDINSMPEINPMPSIDPMTDINQPVFPQQDSNLGFNNIESEQMVSSNLGVPTIDEQNSVDLMNPSQPFESIQPQFIQAEQQSTSSSSNNDNQKSGLGFVIILFILLAIFIFALPYITKLF